jgi:hypothetical protein
MLERQKNIQNSKKAIKCARETKPSLAIQAHQKKHNIPQTKPKPPYKSLIRN